MLSAYWRIPNVMSADWGDSDVHQSTNIWRAFLWYRLIPIFAIYLKKEKVNYFLQWNTNSQTLKVEKILGVVGSMFEFACKWLLRSFRYRRNEGHPEARDPVVNANTVLRLYSASLGREWLICWLPLVLCNQHVTRNWIAFCPTWCDALKYIRLCDEFLNNFVQ